MDKQEFKKQAKQKVDELFVKITELEEKKESAAKHIQAEYQEKLSELKTKKEELQKKYEQLEDVAEEKWEEVKTSFADVSESFKQSLSKIGELFS